MLSLAIENDVEILDEKVVQLDAVLTVETLFEDGSVWVDVVQNAIGIFLFSCSEHNDFVPLVQFFEHILNIWSEAHRDFCILEGKFKCWLEACRDVALKLGRHQSFIHIKDEQLILGLGSDLNRFEHDRVLVVVLLFML